MATSPLPQWSSTASSVLILLLFSFAFHFPAGVEGGVLVNDTYIDIVISYASSADFESKDQQSWRVLRGLCRVPPLPIVPGVMTTMRELEQRTYDLTQPTNQICRLMDPVELTKVRNSATKWTAREEAEREQALVLLPSLYLRQTSNNRKLLPYDDGTWLFTVVFTGTPKAQEVFLELINNQTFESEFAITSGHVVLDTAAVFGSSLVDLSTGQNELSLGWHVILVVGTLLICAMIFTLCTRNIESSTQAADQLAKDDAGMVDEDGGALDDDELETRFLAAQSKNWEEEDTTMQMQTHLNRVAQKEPERIKSMFANTGILGLKNDKWDSGHTAVNTPQSRAQQLAMRNMRGERSTSHATSGSGSGDPVQSMHRTNSATFGAMQESQVFDSGAFLPPTDASIEYQLQQENSRKEITFADIEDHYNATKPKQQKGTIVRKKDFALDKLQMAMAFAPAFTLPLSHQAIIEQEREEKKLREERDRAERLKRQAELNIVAEDLPPMKTPEELEAERKAKEEEDQKRKEEYGLTNGLGLQARRMAAMMSTLNKNSVDIATGRALMRSSELPRQGRIRAFFSMSGSRTPSVLKGSADGDDLVGGTGSLKNDASAVDLDGISAELDKFADGDHGGGTAFDDGDVEMATLDSHQGRRPIDVSGVDDDLPPAAVAHPPPPTTTVADPIDDILDAGPSPTETKKNSLPATQSQNMASSPSPPLPSGSAMENGIPAGQVLTVPTNETEVPLHIDLDDL